MSTLLAVALDTSDPEQARRWAETFGPEVDVIKVGLQLFVAGGPEIVRDVKERGGRPVFLDLKLDDIPNTVAGAAEVAARLGIAWLTVHTAAGEAACAAAVEAVRRIEGPPPQVLGVTVLTSLSARDLKAVGAASDMDGVLDRRARLAAAAGMDGVVCGGADLAVVGRAAPMLQRFVPGVRPDGSPVGDQARVSTISEAVAGGADLIVVGRPITRASDPVAAIANIRAQLS